MSERTSAPPTAVSGSPERRAPSGRPWQHYALASLLLAAAAALVVILATDSGSRRAHSARSAKAPSSTTPSRAATGATQAASAATPGTGSAVGGARRNVAQVADPEEASSYPAPASARHTAAATPAKAREAFLAAGAPSDAEVEAQLAQEQAVAAAAARRQRQLLTPVSGGHSIGGDGTIPIPTNVPEAVRGVIAGANAIANFPYVFGGGHTSFVDNAYDCSGSVSYALAAGGLLAAPLTSGELEHWGAPGPGRYITVLANAGHTYMYVDGMLYNTAGRSGVYASRWQVQPVDNTGYVVRHWPGL